MRLQRPLKNPMTDTEPTTQDTPTPEAETSEVTFNDFPVKQQLLLLGLLLFLICGSFVIPNVVGRIFTQSDSPEPTTKIQYTDNSISNPEFNTPADIDVQIGARAAYVWDVREQRALYKKEPDAVLPLASITKLMTALLAHELMSGTDKIPITMSAILQDGASGFLDGEDFNHEDLRDITLMSSSNDGAFALANAAGALLSDTGNTFTFVDGMNVRAEELELTQTSFSNPTGLDINTSTAGAYGSARDITFLMEYILLNYPDILAATKNQAARVYSTDGLYHDAENTNDYVNEIPGLLGSKTGYTDLAGGNLTIAFDAGLNRPIIVTVLGSTRSGRFSDVERLVNAVTELTE